MNPDTHRDYLIRVGHHGDKHVQQYDYVDHRVRSEEQ